MKHICIHSHARKLAKSGTVSYPATAKLLMRDRLCQVVNIGHCYSNIIEDAQHHSRSISKVRLCTISFQQPPEKD